MMETDLDVRERKKRATRATSPTGANAPVESRSMSRVAPSAVAEECLDTDQVRPGAGGSPEGAIRPAALVAYLLVGVYLGVVFVQSEVVSWYRIQEMFRFQSFHMYGIIGSAVAVAALSLWLIKRLGLRTATGERIELSPKEWGASRIPAARYWLGGALFGMGWALVGACPGPMFALLGAGVSVLAVALLSALAGTWVYAATRSRLPH
jgi:uncharacterized protein